MKTLQVEGAYTLLTLTAHPEAIAPLGEQAAPYVAQSPQMILDVTGIQFTSMLIGELLNLHRRFAAQWQERAHRIALVNVTPTSREVLERVRLTDYLPIFDSVGDAINGAH